MKRSLLALFLVACQQGSGSEFELPNQDKAFLAISKSAESALIAKPDDDTFYVAIKKSELGERWFLSAYLKQVFPYATAGGAAKSLGTQVVSFKVQNNKLFMFRADDTITTSTTFDPQVLIDAYPLVSDHASFAAARGADQYVLVDFASGQSSASIAGNAWGGFGYKFTTELKYMQRYREVDDGITMEMVFSGVTNSDQADKNSASAGEANQLKTSGTLGLALRRYREGEGFKPARPTEQAYFFESDLQLVPNTGASVTPYRKWNIKPGMKPIQWLISPDLLALNESAGLDIAGVVKDSIESWNEVFGFKVFEATIAAADDSFADDTKNYVIYDPSTFEGPAFANSRVNPNTGEIRGATVYFGANFVAHALTSEDDVPPPPAPTGGTGAIAANAVVVAWGSLREDRLCDGIAASNPQWEVPTGTLGPLTAKDKAARYLRWLITHEVGHTLGLRHNFKASLATPASSVMDYLLDADTVERFSPGTYDKDALNFLYDLSDEEPKQDFCTDEDTVRDPACARYDFGADPLLRLSQTYQRVLARVLGGDARYLPAYDYFLNQLLGFVRADASADRRDEALEAALTNLMVGTTTATELGQQQLQDELLATVLKRLFTDPPEARGVFVQTPRLTLPTLLQVSGVLLNHDGFRSYESRRAMVDILKQDQSSLAAAILDDARIAAASEEAAATDAEARAVAHDLLLRITDATSPYFL